MYTIKEEDVQRAAMRGLEDAVKQALGSSYSYSDRFKAIVAKAVHDAEPTVQAVIRQAIVTAAQSPEFAAAVQREMIKSAADKFGGALQGVMIATAKRLASDPEVRDAMVKAATAAVVEAKP